MNMNINISDSSINKTISILNIFLASILVLIFQKKNPCILAILLGCILAYILFRTIDNLEIYTILFCGLILYFCIQIIDRNQKDISIIDKIKNSIWEFVYFTIVLIYINYLKIEFQSKFKN